ncbi:MAG: hypothetical protein ACRDRU_07430 [Pseudonocardiaceae bacterium]
MIWIGIKVPRMLAADLDQPALTPLKILRQQANLPVVGDQRLPTGSENHTNTQLT